LTFSRRSRTGAAEAAMTLRNAPEFGRMAELIRARTGGGPVVLISNHGNLGDALILAGAKAFLTHFGFEHRVVRGVDIADVRRILMRRTYAREMLAGKPLFQKDRVTLRKLARDYRNAIYCGGGYWISHGRKPAVVERLADSFEQMIVMPGTYAMPVPDGIRSRALLFVRDRAQSQAFLPEASFCHDTAFFLDPPHATGTGTGWFIRDDTESDRTIRPPEDNRDVSAEGDEWSDPEIMFDAVRPFTVVVTDRLHLAIAAALTGKRVYLFPSNYFKIPAIFDASIRDHYPQVALVRSMNDLPRDVLASHS
jgi:hypothetical protein